MPRIAHISDVHLSPLPPVTPMQLANKRIIGYLNWQRNRAKFQSSEHLEALITSLKAARPDHIIVSGDMINLGLEAEMDHAKQWLSKLAPPENISVIPGNHDAYVPFAVERATQIWQEFMQGERLDKASFPYVKKVGRVAIINCSSAVASMPFLAIGRFGGAQAARLQLILKDLGQKGYFRIVTIHHPPIAGITMSHRRLVKSERFRAIIKTNGAELVLHGHNHVASINVLKGPGTIIPAIAVPSASASPNSKRPAQYNIYDIDNRTGDWDCQLQSFGYTGTDHTIEKITDISLTASAED